MKPNLLILSAAITLTFLLFSFFFSQPVLGMAEDNPQLMNRLNKTIQQNDAGPCLDILREVAAVAGFEGEEIIISDYSELNRDYYFCSLDVEQKMLDYNLSHYLSYDSARLGIMSVEEDPEIMSGGENTIRTKTTFHGFPALFEFDEPLTENSYLFHWYVPDRKLVFWFSAYNYDSFRNEVGSTSHVYSTPDPLAIAEVFYSVVYNRLPELNLPPPELEPAINNEFVVVEPDEIAEQPEVVVVPYGGDGEETSTATNSFEATWESVQAKTIRSPLLPITGGLIGGGLAWLLTKGTRYAMNTVSSVSQAYNSYVQPPPESPVTPPTLVTTPPELLTSPPELQTSPPELLSAEAQQTKEMLAKGYIWSDGSGWQTKSEIELSDQANKNNAAASADDDAAWRKQWETQKKALVENDKKLKSNAEKLNLQGNLIEVTLKLNEIDTSLRENNIYVYNPNQAIPVWNTITQAKNFAWDKTFSTRGLTCEGYVDETLPQVKKLVQEKFGQTLDKNLKVESYKFDEKSTNADTSDWLSAEDWKNWVDKGIDDNHNLIKVTLPDGSEWAVDFHQHNTGKRPPLLRPWKEAVADWKPYLGENEFRESLIGG